MLLFSLMKFKSFSHSAESYGLSISVTTADLYISTSVTPLYISLCQCKTFVAKSVISGHIFLINCFLENVLFFIYLYKYNSDGNDRKKEIN